MEVISKNKSVAMGAAVVACALVSGAASAQSPAPAGTTPSVSTAAPVTPRTADGHPDVSGQWVPGGVGGFATGAEANVFRGRGNSYVGLEADGALRRTSNDNVPFYKPEYWDQITENDYNGNWEDPVDSCTPLGVPRQGAPHRIVKVEGKPAYLFTNIAGFTGYGGSYQSWDTSRWIWADGRAHDPKYVSYESMQGDAVARWEGDTLVVESVGFTDATWLHKNGWIHGFNMKVTERLTRIGDKLVWEATVEDPDYLQQPWKMTPMVMTLNKSPNAFLAENLPCIVREPFGSHVRSG